MKRIKADRRERRRKLRQRVGRERGGESGKESLEGEGACWWDWCVGGREKRKTNRPINN